MGRPSNREQRRSEIVEGLLEVIATTGYERATVSQIAEAAGLSPGLVHYHFGSKGEVLVALVHDLSDRVDARWRARVAPRATAEARLMALLDAWLARGEGSDSRAVAAWVAIGAEAVFQPEVREAYVEAITHTRDTIAELVAAWRTDAGLDPRPAHRVAALALVAIEGAFQVAASAPDLHPEGWAAPTVKAAVRALALDPGPHTGSS